MNKIRLDKAIVTRKLAETRSQAENYIKLNKVKVNGLVVKKPGFFVNIQDKITIEQEKQYVSRAGLKLESVSEAISIDFKNKTVLDVGSSTGGFTDFALTRGAKKVIAVDVGTDQMHPKLRLDDRVELHEKTDIRNFDTSEEIDVILIDVSFISLMEILPSVKKISNKKTVIVAMAKPQFEAGREKVGKKGVVREISTHKEVVHGIIDFLLEQDLNVLGVGYSPIKGPEGNREYLVYFSKNKDKESSFVKEDIDAVVEASHVEI